MKINLFKSLFFFASFVISLDAYPQQMIDKNTENYLNLYVDYINAGIHGVKFYHKKFEQFNQSLNKYYGEAPFSKADRLSYEGKKGVSLKFESPSVMSDPSAFTVLPEDLYYRISGFAATSLTGEQVQLLQSRVTETRTILKEIMNISANLESYCMDGAYLEDASLEVAYKYLNRAEILLHDFSESKDLLYYEIRKIQNQFLPQSVNNPDTRAYNKLLTFVLYARNVLISMKKEDKNGVFEQLPLMETALSDLRQNETVYLQGVKNPQLVEQYETTMRKAEVFLKITKDYIENPFIEPKYNAYGLAYYNFNNYFLNNYNRYGAGLINDFNRFVEISEMPLLKLPEEVHWLKILPKPFRQDLPVVKPEDPVVVKRDTLKIVITEDPETPEKSEEPLPIAVKDSLAPEPAVSPETPSIIAGAAPVNMVLLLDVSGSMQKPYKLPLLKNSFKNLLGLLRDYDQVSIVVYSGNARVALGSTICSDKKKIMEALEMLETSGKSDVLKGIKLAYKVAQNNYLKNGNNRIILATDGGIDLGEELKKLIIENSNNYDVYLSVFYYEEQEFIGKAEKLKGIAQIGKGNYAYINTENADQMMIKEVNSVRAK